MKLLVGLGNPGREYAETRHNLGWMVAERLAERHGAPWSEFKGCALTARTTDLLLARPTTYMNLSGQAVTRIMAFYGIAQDDLLVVYDDLNLPLGMIRARAAGSSGGHKGIESIIQRLGSDVFPRLRLGIGPVPPHWAGRDFVLSPFGAEDRRVVEQMIDEACDAAGTWLAGGIEKCMNVYNRRITRDAESAGEDRCD